MEAVNATPHKLGTMLFMHGKSVLLAVLLHLTQEFYFRFNNIKASKEKIGIISEVNWKKTSKNCYIQFFLEKKYGFYRSGFLKKNQNQSPNSPQKNLKNKRLEYGCLAMGHF